MEAYRETYAISRSLAVKFYKPRVSEVGQHRMQPRQSKRQIKPRIKRVGEGIAWFSIPCGRGLRLQAPRGRWDDEASRVESLILSFVHALSAKWQRSAPPIQPIGRKRGKKHPAKLQPLPS